MRLVLAVLILALAAPAGAHAQGPRFLRDVGVDQRLGERVRGDLVFHDDAGRAVRLRAYLGGPPVVLTLNDFGCHNLCPVALDELARGLSATGRAAGRDFTLLAVSLDPWDTPDGAREAKAAFVARLGDASAAGVHFLTGDRGTVARLAAAVGVRFVHDIRHEQFVHPAALTVLAPDGTISRYLFGIDHAPRDLRLALSEASHGAVGTPIDRFLLYCYRYDPALGRYSATVMAAVRAAGALTVAGLATFLAVMWRRDPGRRRRGGADGTAP